MQHELKRFKRLAKHREKSFQDLQKLQEDFIDKIETGGLLMRTIHQESRPSLALEKLSRELSLIASAYRDQRTSSLDGTPADYVQGRTFGEPNPFAAPLRTSTKPLVKKALKQGKIIVRLPPHNPGVDAFISREPQQQFRFGEGTLDKPWQDLFAGAQVKVTDNSAAKTPATKPPQATAPRAPTKMESSTRTATSVLIPGASHTYAPALGSSWFPNLGPDHRIYAERYPQVQLTADAPIVGLNILAEEQQNKQIVEEIPRQGEDPLKNRDKAPEGSL